MEAEHEPDTRLEEELTEEELEAEQLSELIEAFEPVSPAKFSKIWMPITRLMRPTCWSNCGPFCRKQRSCWANNSDGNLPSCAMSIVRLLSTIRGRCDFEAVNSLDSDDAALILEDLAEDRQSAILENMEIRDREELERVLAFDEESAGRLMQRDFLAAPESDGGAGGRSCPANAEDLPDVFRVYYRSGVRLLAPSRCTRSCGHRAACRSVRLQKRLKSRSVRTWTRKRSRTSSRNMT